jgi:hypothetical protein
MTWLGMTGGRVISFCKVQHMVGRFYFANSQIISLMVRYTFGITTAAVMWVFAKLEI